MKRLDLLKLRKTIGLSQRALASKLAVQPSFLSAIENGRSRFPDEKIEKLMEATAIEDLEPFMVEETSDMPVVPPHTHSMDESDSLTHLLRHIHNLAHKNDMPGQERETELLERIDYLQKRNDRLSDRVDTLRDTVDALREENYSLKELLRKSGINF